MSVQQTMVKPEKSRYGGQYRSTRKGRSGPRPISTRHSMHLVLRSSLAKGDMSFRKPKNQKRIQEYAHKFSTKYGIKILSLANVGNHLHFHLQLTNRHLYRAFIRALTGAIALAVSGANKNTPLKSATGRNGFWDYRPLTRFVVGLRDFLGIRDYIEINKLEGLGIYRLQAVNLVKSGRWVARSNGRSRAGPANA